MKKQYITAFTGGEEVVELLKSIAAEDGKGLSWHIREAITQYVDELIEDIVSVKNYTMGDLVHLIKSGEMTRGDVYFELRDTTAKFYGMKLDIEEAQRISNLAEERANANE